MRLRLLGRALLTLLVAGVLPAGLGAAARPAGGVSTPAPEAPRPAWLRVTLADAKIDLPHLASKGFDVAGVDLEKQTADVIGTTADAAALADLGFEVMLVRYLDLPAPEVSSQYTDPGEMAALLASFESTYPTLAKLQVMGLTEQGRPYYALKISDNVAVEEDEPAVFFVAEHHAREVMTPEVARDIIDYLLSRYATDPQVQAWVNQTEIWVMPNHNPDGANHVFTVYDLWRKNRRNNGDATFGVDPNRNYPFAWGTCNGSSAVTSDDVYRGPAAGSEPETAALMTLALEQRPVLAISYHTYSELVIYPYGCQGTIPPDRDVSEDLGQRLARRVVRDSGTGFYTPGYGWALLYPVDGELSDWLYATLGTFGYTIEMNASTQGFLPNYSTWRNSTVNRNRLGWQYLLDRLKGPGVRGHVTDACTAAPIAATVGVDEIPLTPNETPRTSDASFGRFDRLLLLGDYHLRLSQNPAPGSDPYYEQVVPVPVRRQPVDLGVRLVPLGSRALEVGPVEIDDETGDGDTALDPGETVRLLVTARATGAAVSGITATLSTIDPLVRIVDGAATYANLAASAAALPADDGFEIVIDAAAPEGHVPALHVAFSAAEALCVAGGDLAVKVTAGTRTCPHVFTFNTNPGWTISNNTTGGWAFGVPAGFPPGRAPSSGFTGANVYGTELLGNYSPGGDYQLTTSILDLTGRSNTTLEFQRWIATEQGYDYATVEASTNGTTWTLLWTGSAVDLQWRRVVLDASAVDGAPAARFRFTLKTDFSGQDTGVYLDDVSVCGDVTPPQPRLRATQLAVVSDTLNAACTDADGVADAGEIVRLRLTAANQGLATALAATATLRPLDASLEVLSGPQAVGDVVGSGGQKTADFLVWIDAATACGKVPALTVEFLSNGGVSTSSAPPALVLEKDGGGCDVNTCPSACAPGTPIVGVDTDAAGRLTWTASADPCHSGAGVGYRIYRATSARPLVVPATLFPQDTAFADRSLLDADGSLLDAGFTDSEAPAARGVFYYLVTDVGTNGVRGPVEHYGQ